MPLIDAFQHIQQVAGGEQLAEEELRLRIASGDVEAQDRRVTPGEGIDIIPLSPEDLSVRTVCCFPASPSTSATCTARRISATTCCAALTGTASVATISSCAALTCTAYGRSPATQRAEPADAAAHRLRREAAMVLPPKVKKSATPCSL